MLATGFFETSVTNTNIVQKGMACSNHLLILKRRALHVAQRGLKFGVIQKKKSRWWREQNKTGSLRVSINVTLRRVGATISAEKKK
jgi:hypothetical protein